MMCFILFLFFRKLLFANNVFLYQEIVLNDVENLPFPYYYYYFLNEYMFNEPSVLASSFMPGFRQAAQSLSIGPWGSQGRGLEEVLGLGLG